MAVNEIHLGDIGVVFQRTIKDSSTGAAMDVSTATTKSLLLHKPNGSLVTKALVFATNGVNGVVQYTTLASDLDQIGVWYLQIYLEMGGAELHSDIDKFTVFDNLR